MHGRAKEIRKKEGGSQTSYRRKIMNLSQPRKFSTSRGSDLDFQVREDDAWMRSTAAINNNERESLFKALAEKTQLSKLDLKGMHISSVYPLFQTSARSHSYPYLSTSQVYLFISTSQVCRSRQWIHLSWRGLWHTLRRSSLSRFVLSIFDDIICTACYIWHYFDNSFV